MHYSYALSLWQFIFFHVSLFSCCTYFMFHFSHMHQFHDALFCVVIFPCCTFFVLNSFYVLHYFMLHFYRLQCFRFVFFSCCTLRTLLHFFLLNFVHVALFQKCSREPHRWRSKMESLKPLNILARFYILDIRGGPGRVYYFHAALFPCCTFFMLHSFHVALF